MLIAEPCKLDIPNRQGWIHRAFAKKLEWPNLLAMSETVDVTSVRAALREIMDRKGVKPTTLSLMVGKNRSLVKDLFERTNDIGVGTLIKLAGALDVPVSDLLSAPRVAIVGYIGAGGTIIFEDLGNDEAETVVRPPNISTRLVALVVRGDSMLPKYQDGDILYISRDHDGVLPSYLGRDCVVRLATGETYIKQLMKGSEEGRFTLFSLNAPPIEDVEVTWATPVAFIMPAQSRALFS